MHYHWTINLTEERYHAISRLARCKDFILNIEIKGQDIENDKEIEEAIKFEIIALLSAVKNTQ